MNIFTGSYDNCKCGNLISISGDMGKRVSYVGNVYTKLAPKMSFWKEWHNNIGNLNEEENNKFYMEKYYETVLKELDAKEVFNELLEFGNDIILLCYEQSSLFCHRHLVAAWLEFELNINVLEIQVLSNGERRFLNVQEELKNTFKDIIMKQKILKRLVLK